MLVTEFNRSNRVSTAGLGLRGHGACGGVVKLELAKLERLVMHVFKTYITRESTFSSFVGVIAI